MKFGNLNFLEPSGPPQACKGTALPLPVKCKCAVLRNATYQLPCNATRSKSMLTRRCLHRRCDDGGSCLSRGRKTPYFRATKGMWNTGVWKATAAAFSLNKVAMQILNCLKLIYVPSDVTLRNYAFYNIPYLRFTSNSHNQHRFNNKR
jgi:hypothetical protein